MPRGPRLDMTPPAPSTAFVGNVLAKTKSVTNFDHVPLPPPSDPTSMQSTSSFNPKEIMMRVTIDLGKKKEVVVVREGD